MNIYKTVLFKGSFSNKDGKSPIHYIRILITSIKDYTKTG